MSVTFFDILVAILSVLVAPFLVQGVIKSKSHIGHIIQIMAGISLVAFFLVVWGNTGRDPLQWSYCFVNRSAVSCQSISWPVIKIRLPSIAMPHFQRRKVTPQDTTRSTQKPNNTTIVWRPASGQSVSAYLQGLSIKSTLNIEVASIGSLKTEEVRYAVNQANAALEPADKLLIEAVRNGIAGTQKADENANQKPRVYIGYDYGPSPFRGELDGKGAPNGYGKIGGVDADGYNMELGRFFAEGDTKNGYFLRPEGAYLILGAPKKGMVLFAARSTGWTNQRADGPHVLVTDDGLSCAVQVKYQNSLTASGYGLCRYANGDLYAGQVRIDQKAIVECKIDSQFCFSIERRGYGAMYSANGSLIREGKWSDKS
jgi:hypothetical protein